MRHHLTAVDTTSALCTVYLSTVWPLSWQIIYPPRSRSCLPGRPHQEGSSMNNMNAEEQDTDNWFKKTDKRFFAELIMKVITIRKGRHCPMVLHRLPLKMEECFRSFWRLFFPTRGTDSCKTSQECKAITASGFGRYEDKGASQEELYKKKDSSCVYSFIQCDFQNRAPWWVRCLQSVTNIKVKCPVTANFPLKNQSNKGEEVDEPRHVLAPREQEGLFHKWKQSILSLETRQYEL